MKVLAISDDGSEADVTEGVRVLYDTVIASMDWGSRFLDNEGAFAVVRAATACGFVVPDEARVILGSYLTLGNTWDPPPPPAATGYYPDAYRSNAFGNQGPKPRRVNCAICGGWVHIQNVWTFAENYAAGYEWYAATPDPIVWTHNQARLDHEADIWGAR